jgi:NAD+ synthase
VGEYMEDLTLIKEKIISFIKQSVDEANAKGIVFGLSGGIDSALVAALAKEAVGADNVLGVVMPCYSHPQDMEDARLVAEKLDIKTKLVDLSQTFDNLKLAIGVEESDSKLTIANIKPRLRMTTLYYYASKHNYLVAGTGNRSEIAIGYFTKYGDGGSDILPISTLVKKQVWDMSRIMGVPTEVIDKAPSAGLWENQTDEQEMGLTYKQLDEFILTGQGEDWVKEKIEKMHRISEHKRQLPKKLML